MPGTLQRSLIDAFLIILADLKDFNRFCFLFFPTPLISSKKENLDDFLFLIYYFELRIYVIHLLLAAES